MTMQDTGGMARALKKQPIWADLFELHRLILSCIQITIAAIKYLIKY